MVLIEGLLDGNFQAMWHHFSCGLELNKPFSIRQGQFQKVMIMMIIIIMATLLTFFPINTIVNLTFNIGNLQLAT